MKLGIQFDNRPETNYLGVSRYTCPYFIADVSVSPLVERAVELTKDVWSQGEGVPLARLDIGNHGVNRGLVLKYGVFDPRTFKC